MAVLHGPPPGRTDPFPVEVVGESHYQDALWEAVGSRETVDRRSHVVRAVLRHEPDNQYDSNAIAVLVGTSRGYAKVGHLPRALAAAYVADFKNLRSSGYDGGACDAVILGGFADQNTPGGVASLGIRLHLDDPGEIVPRGDEEPRTFEAYGQEKTRRASTKGVRPSVRSPETTGGMVRGRHYTEWVDDIASLKRHKAHEQCSALLYEIIDAAEQEAKDLAESPPPWYYEQLAIVLRKMRDSDAEIAILKRYVLFPHPRPNPNPQIEDRLRKAIAKRG